MSLTEILRFILILISVWLESKRKEALISDLQKKDSEKFQKLLSKVITKYQSQQKTEAQKIHELENQADLEIQKIQASKNASDRGS